jgi:hypothetical protein
VVTLTLGWPNMGMTTEVSLLSEPWFRGTSGSSRASTGELAALHGQLVLRLRTMVTRHSPGCAFVAAYPSVHDLSPNEILVIPFSSDAALFSIGFCRPDCATMKVRIGEHGVLEYPREKHLTPSLAASAERLFSLTLNGRYREDVWIDSETGRYEGGQSYFLDDSDEWQVLGPRPQPCAPLKLTRRGLTVQNRRYQPY